MEVKVWIEDLKKDLQYYHLCECSKSESESMKRRLIFLHDYHVCECFAKCQKAGFLSHLTFHLMLINWTKAKY